ncbi:MAG: hypothetical protein HC918_11985, partial [Oscillatoriales cyanobacterium SM2_1_8]|nr:hypothetical protein [Oscillatoriales cyanobacterium SM2_1_8]
MFVLLGWGVRSWPRRASVPAGERGPQVTEAVGGPLWVVAAGSKEPLMVGRVLSPQDRLVLENGRLQVVWPDGTIARLEGPTAWQLEDAQQSTLQDGRLLVWLPPTSPPVPSTKRWQFPGGTAVVAPGGAFFVAVARDRTVRLAQLEGETLVFRPNQGDRPVLRLGSSSQLTVRADGQWEPPTVLVPGRSR